MSLDPKNCDWVYVLRTKKHVLPCQTSHVQSPLDRVDYGGQGLMISAAGLKRESKT